jgi:hypothetical protein
MPNPDFSARLQRLDALLYKTQWLWRPQPFKQARPGWCQRLPALTAQLLALGDAELAALTADDSALLRLLAGHLPELAEFEPLCQLPQRELTALNPISPHLTWAIPGRKWSQIEAFAQAIGPVRAPLLEWCGGKGHLGRLLAVQWQVPVTTLEYGATLCTEGEQLAARARVAQQFEVVDVLTPVADMHLPRRHAVALHACGELHRTLLRRAVVAQSPAIDIAPCCYHLGSAEDYRPFSASATLQLSPDELRLAVTETVTSSAREVRRRDREMAWKLGFDQLRRDRSSDDSYRPIRPIEKPWLNLEFSEFCQRLAQRDGVVLGDAIDWPHYEQQGWQRQREVMRLSLVRNALRRPLELWLVLDMASYLDEQGYRVELGTFCPRQITPRNLLLSARR